MILTYVSLFVLAWMVLRFVLPMPCTLTVRVLVTLFILFVSFKFQIYGLSSGVFFNPKLPRWLLLIMETLYSSLVLLVLMMVIRDVLAVLLWVARKLGSTWRLPSVTFVQNMVLAVLALLLGGYGVAQSIRVPDVRTVEISVSNLPQQLDGFSLVQLSDLHVGPLLKRDWLCSVIEKTNAAKPDLIVITGDFLDGWPDTVLPELEPLAGLHAPYGVMGITGNHEYLYDAMAWSTIFEKLGVDMLFNEHRIVTVEGSDGAVGKLVILGIPDRAARRSRGTMPNLGKALENAPRVPRILLAHRPDNGSTPGVDLQLSGHTHGGVMFFLKPVVARFNRGYVNGLYQRDETALYVNPGTGIWNGFSCRLGVPSEITRIVLRGQK